MASSDILERILAHKRLELVQAKAQVSLAALEKRVQEMPAMEAFNPATGGAFLAAMRNPDYKRMRIIAEVKKASPSKGVIAHDFDPLATAGMYDAHGADAISVLTEQKFFQGKGEYLEQISQATKRPCLRKDFLFEEYQILEARAWGAKAFLLIVDCLDATTLQRLLKFGLELGLDALVEVHDEREVDTALECGARIIGVNNRNLRTFEVDLNTTLRLRPLVPLTIPLVAESGISKPEEISALLQAKVSAVLVGEAFMKQGKALLESFTRAE